VGNPDNSVDVRTFSDLLKDVDSVASEIKTQYGFKVGDKALVVSPNHADYFTSVYIFTHCVCVEKKNAH
jgi:acyl-CoA synthetase (AMP-forming)/AMP-acid ligase II